MNLFPDKKRDVLYFPLSKLEKDLGLKLKVEYYNEYILLKDLTKNFEPDFPWVFILIRKILSFLILTFILEMLLILIIS